MIGRSTTGQAQQDVLYGSQIAVLRKRLSAKHAAASQR